MMNHRSGFLAAAACFAILLAFPAGAQDLASSASSLVGTWSGTLSVGPAALRIVFHVTESGGKLQATMDSPDQRVTGIPVDEVVYDGVSVRFDLKAAMASCEGILDASGKTLQAVWKQSGLSFPLVLEKAAEKTEQKTQSAPSASDYRPQEPLPPFPYRTIDLVFDSRTESGPAVPPVRLAGTLTLPEGKGPFPAAVLVSGSGPQNRDELILGHKPFLVIADYLAKRGIAVLRYDDRGVGASSGDFSAATTMDFAADAVSALLFLSAREEIDAARTGVIGHSEGGIIASIVASEMPQLAFAILLAGPGMPGKNLLLLQNAALARASGASHAAIAESRALNASLYEIALKDGETSQLRAEIRKALEATGMDQPALDAQTASIAAQLLNPWFRQFLALDPAEYLARVRIPVLAMIGSRDLQVPADENIAAIDAALRSAGNGHYRTISLEGLNHLFQRAESGLPSEYGFIPETFSPLALEAMGEWLDATLKQQGGGK